MRKVANAEIVARPCFQVSASLRCFSWAPSSARPGLPFRPNRQSPPERLEERIFLKFAETARVQRPGLRAVYQAAKLFEPGRTIRSRLLATCKHHNLGSITGRSAVINCLPLLLCFILVCFNLWANAQMADLYVRFHIIWKSDWSRK